MRLYAHRGSPGTAPYENAVENTVPAVSASLADADGVEVDVRLAADGTLVVCHDPDLRRLTGLPMAVAANSWDDLRVACHGRGVPLARMDWVLAAVAGRPVVLELKHPPPGLTAATAAAVVTRLRELARAGLPLDVTLSSFAPSLVAEVRRLAPDLRTALLGDRGESATAVLRRALDGGHDEVHPHVTSLLAEPGAVAAAHALGARVVPWTVNRTRDLRRLASLGVDAVITDVPAAARLAVTPRHLPA